MNLVKGTNGLKYKDCTFFDIRKDEFVCSGAVKGGGNNCRRLISRKEIGRLLILRKTVL